MWSFSNFILLWKKKESTTVIRECAKRAKEKSDLDAAFKETHETIDEFSKPGNKVLEELLLMVKDR